MAMTKKEQLERDLLRADLRVAMALHATPVVFPDVPVPTGEQLTRGWLATGSLTYPETLRAKAAASTAVLHGTSNFPKVRLESRDCKYRGGVSLFSTELLCWQAVRNIVEREAGMQLVRIDEEIRRCQERQYAQTRQAVAGKD